MNELLSEMLDIYMCPSCRGASEQSVGDCDRCRYRGVNYAKLTKAPKPTGASYTYVTPVIGVDYGTEPSITVATNKCALCSVLFTADADEQFIAAHAKVCEKRPVQAGDYVRWDNPIESQWWCEGELLRLRTPACDLVADIMVRRGTLMADTVQSVGLRNTSLRRIPRPVSEAKAHAPHPFIRGAESGPERLGPPDETCAVCQCDPRNTIHLQHKVTEHAYAYNPAVVSARCARCGRGPGDHTVKQAPTTEVPVLYDGMSTMECYRKWCDNRALVERGGPPLYVLTPAQITAGRATYLSDALNEHSAELRRKLAASKERERMQVVVDQDGEDFPW